MMYEEDREQPQGDDEDDDQSEEYDDDDGDDHDDSDGDGDDDDDGSDDNDKKKGGSKRGRQQDDEEDDDDDYGDKKRKSKKTKSNNNGSGAAKTGKKRGGGGGKKKKGSNLFDDEAEDNDDDEDEGIGRGEADDRILTAHEREAQLRVDRRNQGMRMLDANDAEIAKRYEERAKYEKVLEQHADEHGFGTAKGIPPKDTDPRLFMVRCRRGEEKRLVFSILLKFEHDMEEFKNRKAPQPQIVSCFWTGTSGYIYIEANSEKGVKDAVDGLQGIYFSKFTQIPRVEQLKIIQIKEKSEVEIKPGAFVRLRRKPYKGDLGRVFDPEFEDGKALVMVVPRTDFQIFPMSPEERKARAKEGIIPPQKMYNRTEYKENGANVFVSSEAHEKYNLFFDVVEKDMYRHGLLYKAVPRTSLQVTGVAPTPQELEHFKATTHRDEDYAPEETEADAAAAYQKAVEEFDPTVMAGMMAQTEKEDFKSGDVVEVVAGEQIHWKGVIKSVDEKKGIAIVKSDTAGTVKELSISCAFLSKHFQDGNHVKVIGGRYAGETGAIVQVPNRAASAAGNSTAAMAVVMTDRTTREILVLPRDLRLSQEIAAGQENLDGYKLYDLVQIDQQMVGVIVNVGMQDLSVYLQTEEVKTIIPANIKQKKNLQSRRTTVKDANFKNIGVGDTVKITSGKNAGIEAEIKHIFRSYLFLHSNARPSNAGIFVDRARNVALAGERIVDPRRFTKAMDGRPGRRDHVDPLLHRRMRVKSGRFKGFVGLVVNVTGDRVSVELEARGKVQSFDKSELEVEKDDHVEFAERPSDYFGNQGATPLHPSLGSGTPMASTSSYAPGTPMNYPSTPSVSTDTSHEAQEAWSQPSMQQPQSMQSSMPPPTRMPSSYVQTPAAANLPVQTPGAYMSMPTPSAQHMPVQTPAYSDGMYKSSAYPQTPGMMGVPQTPGTAIGGVPQTPGVAAGFTGMRPSGNEIVKGSRVRVMVGKYKGSTGIFSPVDDDYQVVLDNGGMAIVDKVQDLQLI